MSMTQEEIDNYYNESLDVDEILKKQLLFGAIRKLMSYFNEIYWTRYPFFSSKFDMLVLEDLIIQIMRRRNKLCRTKIDSIERLALAYDKQEGTEISSNYKMSEI